MPTQRPNRIKFQIRPFIESKNFFSIHRKVKEREEKRNRNRNSFRFHKWKNRYQGVHVKGDCSSIACCFVPPFFFFSISPIVNGSNFPKRIKAKNATLEICSVFTHCAQHMFTMRIKIHKMFLLRSTATKKNLFDKKKTRINEINESNHENHDGGNNITNEIKLSNERMNERTKRYLPDV